MESAVSEISLPNGHKIEQNRQPIVARAPSFRHVRVRSERAMTTSEGGSVLVSSLGWFLVRAVTG